VTVQTKDDVLMVPKKAVHTTGDRHYVEYLAGSSRKVADVDVGISSDTDTEITRGLAEGQLVLVGP
jgi:hypothetical protein